MKPVHQQILDAIREFDTIIIHRHVRPDPDAYGSQGGLAALLRASFPEKRVYAVGTDDPSLSFLRQMDVIDDAVYEQALVIVCDTANEERICDSRYRLGRKLIKIDHHPNDTPYGDIMWVDTAASSTSEMIYEFYLAGKEEGLTMTVEAARLIYAGIVGDTGRFLFPRTSVKNVPLRWGAHFVRFFADGIVRRIVSDELAARPLKRLCVVELYDRGRGGGCENAAGAAWGIRRHPA